MVARRRGGSKRQNGKTKSKQISKGRTKSNPKNTRQNKKPGKQRATYSVYKLRNLSQNPQDTNLKRKTKDFDNKENKRQKIENLELEVESEEEVVEDDISKLLDTFGGELKNKTAEAIESSDDSDASDDEDKENVEKRNTVTKENGTKKIEDKAEVEDESLDKENEDNDLENAEDVDLENVEDNFNLHLAYELNNSVLSSLQSTPTVVKNHLENWPCLGKLSIQIPRCELQKPSENKISITGEQKFAPSGKVPTIYNKSRSAKLSIKSQIIDNIHKANPCLTSSDDEETLFTPLQNEVFSIIDNYQDFYFAQRTLNNAEELRFVYCVHAINHVLKTRMRVIHHNARLSKKDDVPEDFRDQGLVRPKVRILLVLIAFLFSMD